MDKVKFFTILSLVIAAMVGGYILMESIMPIHNKKPAPKYEIGKCYKTDNDDPFAEPIYIKIIDKKKGYVKYVFSSSPEEKLFVSRPENWLEGLYKEVDCADFEKGKQP